ncbi:hypothetical protein [Nodosilinea nodulosa]|uniref:hypothetical protein n=1 Tax=Nodosilinea nodulosa TaxID=416001 RepID=UPI000371DB1F|nr:hypothetical protein [Nodosilinea nodulosa]
MATSTRSVFQGGVEVSRTVNGGRSANAGIYGQRSSSGIDNEYNLRNEVDHWADQRMNQARLDNRADQATMRRDAMNNQAMDRNDARRAAYNDYTMGVQSFNEGVRQSRAQERQTDYQNQTQRFANQLDYNARMNTAGMQSFDNMRGLMAQLAIAKGEQGNQERSIFADLTKAKWSNDTQRRGDLLGAYSNLSSSYTNPTQYKYWS